MHAVTIILVLVVFLSSLVALLVAAADGRRIARRGDAVVAAREAPDEAARPWRAAKEAHRAVFHRAPEGRNTETFLRPLPPPGDLPS